MQIRVTVLAVADPSMRNVFAPLEQASARAYGKVSGGAKRSAKESAEVIKAGLRDQAAAQGSAYRQSGRQYEESVRAVSKAESAKTKEIDRHEKVRAQLRQRAQAEEARDARRAASAAKEDARRRGTDDIGTRRRTVGAYRDFGRDVVGNVGRGARAVVGVTGDIARGAGIDPSLGGLTQRVLATEGATRRATTSGMMASGKVATVADIASSDAAVRATGDATSTSYTDVATGLEAFTAKSSDLEVGKRKLTELMQLSQATGSNFQDLASAAGSVNQSLEAGPDKAERMADVMRVIAKQGAMGSVEMKDLAAYMPRISSVSEKFAGDRSTTMAQFGAIAQMGVHSGQGTSAEATRASAALARDLTGRAVQKQLQKQNIDVFSDKSRTKMRSIEDIIVDVFKNTQGDQVKLSALFANSKSRAGIEAFSGTYDEAGGGQAGEDAIRAKFAEFTKTISAKDVTAVADLTKNSKAGQAQAMQNRFETTWASALEKIVPAMETLAPSIGKVADSFASLVVYLAENPGKAIAAALTASVAKAGIGAVLNAAMEKAIMGGGAAGKTSSSAGGVLGGGVAGSLLTSLTILATAATAAAAGIAIMDAAFRAKDERDNKNRHDALLANVDADNAVTRVERGAISKEEAIASLTAQKAELDAKIASGESAPSGVIDSNVRGIRDIANFVSGSGPSWESSMNDKANAASVEENKAAAANVAKALEAVAGLSDKTLTVRVVNMPAGGEGFGTRYPMPGAGRTGDVP